MPIGCFNESRRTLDHFYSERKTLSEYNNSQIIEEDEASQEIMEDLKDFLNCVSNFKPFYIHSTDSNLASMGLDNFKVCSIFRYPRVHFSSHFNVYSIFNPSFENSYRQAIVHFSSQQRESLLEKCRLFICIARDSDLDISLPSNVIYTILRIEIMIVDKSLLFPSCAEFQTRIFKFLSMDEKDQKEIRKEFKKPLPMMLENI